MWARKTMKLIGALGSPYVRKVRVVMAEKKIEFEFIPEDVWSSDATISKLNPLGKVPTLIMEDGGAVFDSRVICEHLDTVSPLHKLMPAVGRSRIEVKTWEALADGLCDAAIAWRLENMMHPPEHVSQKWQDRQMKKIHDCLDAIASGIGTKTYCAEGKYTLADVAVGCALGYLDFRFPQIDWRANHPKLAAYAQKLFARQAFIDTAPK
jgi:glutathione S-transferase